MAHFIVDRKTWYRGKGITDSRLLSKDGMRCCIGFVGNQCGVPDKNLLDRSTVEDVIPEYSHIDETWPDWMRGYSPDLRQAYSTNDSMELTDPERESHLALLFANHGDTIEFRD